MADAARAYVNHGRWVAHCPVTFCTGAERVWPGGQSRVIDRGENKGRKYGITPGGTMHCGSCGTSSRVEFPEDREGIDRVLNRRPALPTRNWLPGESVDDLEAENRERGVT